MTIRLTRFLMSCTIVLAGFIAVPAQAQYVGPGSVTLLSSVSEVLKNPVEDQKVLLRGRLVKKLSRDKFLFADATGQIRVEIDDDLFRNHRVSDKTEIEIYGEVEKEFFGDPEVDVKRMSVITP